MRISSVIFFLVFSPMAAFSQMPIHLVGEAQGTSYSIFYYDSLERDFYREVRQLLQQFDASLSTYDTTSLISQINRNSGDPMVDHYFETCFRKAKEIWKNTDGAFDPTVYPLVNSWGFGPDVKQRPDSSELDSMLQFVGFEKVELVDLHVRKSDFRVQLDFNAFAQGYSVDVVGDFLEKQGVDSYLIEIGGEVFARGRQATGEDWLVGIEKPEEGSAANESIQVIVRLENRAVATSGNYRKFTVENGVKLTHQIDPKTGYSAKNNLLSVSVFANDCLTADAYATALSVMGLDKSIEFLEKHPELQAFLIYSDANGMYQFFKSPLLEEIIVLE